MDQQDQKPQYPTAAAPDGREPTEDDIPESWKAWRRENAEAIAWYNRFVEEHGILLEEESMIAWEARMATLRPAEDDQTK